MLHLFVQILNLLIDVLSDLFLLTVLHLEGGFLVREALRVNIVLIVFLDLVLLVVLELAAMRLGVLRYAVVWGEVVVLGDFLGPLGYSLVLQVVILLGLG